MALFKLTVKRSQNVNGIRIEKGMTVEVVHGYKEINPNTIFTTLEGKEKIARAFLVKYNIDAKKACLINSLNLESQIVGEK